MWIHFKVNFRKEWWREKSTFTKVGAITNEMNNVKCGDKYKWQWQYKWHWHKFDCVILRLIMLFPSSFWQVHHWGSSTIVISSGVELDDILKMGRIRRWHLCLRWEEKKRRRWEEEKRRRLKVFFSRDELFGDMKRRWRRRSEGATEPVDRGSGDVRSWWGGDE